MYCQTFPTPLSFPIVEGVQADQLAGLLRRHVTESAASGCRQRAPGPIGEQPCRLGAVHLQDRQPLVAGLQAHAAQEPVDGGRGEVPAAVLGAGQVGADARGAPGRMRQGHREEGPFGLHTEGGRPASAWPGALGIQPIGPVGQVPAPPPVEQGAGDPELPAGLADVAQGLRPGYHPQAEGVYTGLEGHRRSSPSPHEGLVSNGKDTSYDPPLL